MDRLETAIPTNKVMNVDDKISTNFVPENCKYLERLILNYAQNTLKDLS